MAENPVETVRECEILPAAEMLLGFDEDTLRGEKNKFPSLVIVVSRFFKRNMDCHISFSARLKQLPCKVDCA